jgi:hypothetical protein
LLWRKRIQWSTPRKQTECWNTDYTKIPCIAVGAFGPSLFIRDFAVGQIKWGVTSQFPILVFHRSSAFLRVIRLMVFVTWFTAVLHFSCHKFISLCFCFNRRSNPGRSLFKSETVILLVESLYAEAIEAANSRAGLSASTPELIWILGDTKSEAIFWNRSQSVNFSIGSERFLVVTWSSMWKSIGRWSYSRTSATMTSDSRTFWWTSISSTSPFPAGK